MAAQDALFYSQVPIDNIIAIFEGDVTIPERTDPQAVVTIPTGINATTFFQGKFSIDGEDYYNDIGGYKYINDGAGSFTRLGLRGKSTAGSLILTTETNDTVTHSCHYQVALMAKPNQGTIDVDSPNLPEYFYSQRNYQKIALDSVQNLTLAYLSANTTNITHGLGYRPSYRMFLERNGYLIDAASEASLLELFSADLLRADIFADDANVITIELPYTNTDAPAFTLYTRIYYDPS